MKYAKILRHPDRNEILDKIAKKEMSIEAVHRLLKERYGDDKELTLSATYLRNFVKKGLQLDYSSMTAEEFMSTFSTNFEDVEVPASMSQAAAEIQETIDDLAEMSNYLTRKYMALANLIVDECLTGERDIKDAQSIAAAYRSVSQTHIDFSTKVQTVNTSQEDSFDSFIAGLETEAGESHD